MATFTIGGGGNFAFATIAAALASGAVAPGDTLALFPGYNSETATVGIENLTFSGDASNTGITLWLGSGITAVTLDGTAPIVVAGNWSDNSITGNDGSNRLLGDAGNDIIAGGGGADTLAGNEGNDSINGGAGADTIYYFVGDYSAGIGAAGTGGAGTGASPADVQYFVYYPQPGDGIDIIDGGADHDMLSISGSPVQYDYEGGGKGYGGDNYLTAVVVNGAITGIAGGRLANV